MANPLFNMLMGKQGGVQRPVAPQMSGMRFQNPVQKMQYVLQAMQNPAAFVRQALPEIPEYAYNDPTGNGILQYMMQSMGVTQQDIKNIYEQANHF